MSNLPPYTFDESQPHTWQNFAEPYLAQHWRDELVTLAGRHLNGQPNLIFEWGGNAREVIDSESGLKFWLCTTHPKFYQAINPRTGLVQVVKETRDIGVPRWYVTRYMPPSDGFPDGRYVFFMKITGLNNAYSAINDEVMERIRRHWQYTINRNAADYAADIRAAVTGTPSLADSLLPS